MMKRSIILLISAVFCMVACGPSRHAVHVEMRYPSKAGVELAGKKISVVYVSDGTSVASGFNEAMADGFAYALEQDYATGDGSIELYRVPVKADAHYSSRDSMLNLLIETSADAVFLFDLPQLGEMQVSGQSRVASPTSPDSTYLSAANIQYRLVLYCYDGMNKEDKVTAYGGISVASPAVYSDGRSSAAELKEKAYKALPEAAWDSGRTVADSFKSQWKHEQYSLAYYDADKWYEALIRAEQYDWKGAVDIWLTCLDTGDLMKKACAEYNISVACYMAGDYKLALEWLDRSDADNKLPTLSDAMRKRINARLSL
ncbi:MAG: hypothetical protein E7118_03840 [Bacteroidales bacterium]|nr:hypothetical protein [Bacteroidales bacterium]